ncbi:MAG: hypothetical protein CVV27_03605 [Candidatus Melainabacteria bacterium HGW-Melainabacteria-1]|nr:MAG: hypothetical protein CVV27_03605 [Candidatus Melainabacteria bacterium HGW-Melainabacteria-1]
MDLFSFTTLQPVSIRDVQRVFEELVHERVAMPIFDEFDGPSPILTSTCMQSPDDTFSFTPYLNEPNPVECLRELARKLGVEVVADMDWQGTWREVLATPSGDLFEIFEDADEELDFSQRSLLEQASSAV